MIGIDIRSEHCDLINHKKFTSPEPLVNEYLQSSQNLRATTLLKEGTDFSDIIFIFVDTPIGIGGKSYDHSNVGNVLTEIVNKCFKLILKFTFLFIFVE